ncbi:hypothetical protein A4D02_35375 [Niastella koreensis]|uniref:Zinc finger CHC2-type domain-containing protein n=2 Tax=Niastella koreensis TaxID=354356 RepID=G8TJH6_NIAKG|nr:CHC2 zinc finger domain-containing protein [Niastella koreensis]AEV99711.1 hypothetical protein Niako_3406 [Niastella koreensis GR20-10]OQP44263.1 hypothetical protein A4D02_35375 [Niastella koreensis]
MNIEQANKIPIAEILDKINCKPKRISGYDNYYLAPWRHEKTASLHVNTLKNIWYDHGIGEGGDVVRLICKYLESSGVDYTVSDALRWVKNMCGFASVIQSVQNADTPVYESKLKIVNAQDIERPALIRYLESRGIPMSVAKQYLQQVDVYNRERNKSIYALGFKNDKGGYELRNKYFKGSTAPKYITFVRGEGGTSAKPDGIHLFEGWPDYLTAIIHQRNGQKFTEDTIVLNSLANLKKATPYIKGYGYRTAYTWMHNDDPGKAATISLDNFFKTEEDLVHKPMNEIYAPYKDMNAWHIVKLGL